jgi:hypothetical protein
MGSDGWHVAWEVVLTFVVCIPLAVSLWALLDAAHRPGYAWALAARNRVAWMAAILVSAFLVLPGIVVAVWYLVSVRPRIAAAEEGNVEL